MDARWMGFGGISAANSIDGKIQDTYGIARNDAEKQVEDWEARNKDNDFPKHRSKAENSGY